MPVEVLRVGFVKRLLMLACLTLLTLAFQNCAMLLQFLMPGPVDVAWLTLLREVAMWFLLELWLQVVKALTLMRSLLPEMEEQAAAKALLSSLGLEGLVVVAVQLKPATLAAQEAVAELQRLAALAGVAVAVEVVEGLLLAYCHRELLPSAPQRVPGVSRPRQATLIRTILSSILRHNACKGGCAFFRPWSKWLPRPIGPEIPCGTDHIPRHVADLLLLQIFQDTLDLL